MAVNPGLEVPKMAHGWNKKTPGRRKPGVGG